MKHLKVIWLGVLFLNTLLADGANYIAKNALTAPVIDGAGTDACWSSADWAPIDQRWLGNLTMTEVDFTGRFKAVWTSQKVYFLVEITDDVLYDANADPLVKYPDDDCVEIFIDEDHSGGLHNTSTTAYNAFAYHVSLSYDVVDNGADGKPHLFPNHVKTVRKLLSESIWLWEMEMTVYDDSFVLGSTNNSTVTLAADKVMGFSLAYCDNDQSATREHFIGSEYIPVPNSTSNTTENVSWLNADHFGTMTLSSIVTGTEGMIFENAYVYYDSEAKKIRMENFYSGEVKLLNSLGKKVLEKSNQDSEIPLNNLAPGIYFLYIESNGRNLSRKIIVH